MSLDLEVISCATKACHVIFALPVEVVSRLRETGETFSCPFGHEQHFSNSKDEQIKRLKAQANMERDTRIAVEAEADKLRGQVKRLKKNANTAKA